MVSHPDEPAKKKQIPITHKVEMCRFKRDNPKAKQVDLIEKFSKLYGHKISSSTMSEILKNSDFFLNNDLATEFRYKKP